MIQPWFSPEIASRFVYLSLLSLFALIKIPASRGRYRALMMAAWNSALLFGAVLVLAALLAAVTGQAGYVVRALGGSGIVIAAVFGLGKSSVRTLYAEAELRKTIASDL